MSHILWVAVIVIVMLVWSSAASVSLTNLFKPCICSTVLPWCSMFFLSMKYIFCGVHAYLFNFSVHFMFYVSF